jgi:GNAT superfamily N-acetyltransferase
MKSLARTANIGIWDFDIPNNRLVWDDTMYRLYGISLDQFTGAYEAWLKSITPFLGRFASVVVAELNGDLVAFVAGRIRTLPPYFGSSTIGTISEVFVCESHRGAGIGRRLLNFALEWFQGQQITRVELQVVAGNQEGVRFYRQLGWHEELVQMVWDSSPAAIRDPPA